jgi:hypothetical protein
VYWKYKGDEGSAVLQLIGVPPAYRMRTVPGENPGACGFQSLLVGPTAPDPARRKLDTGTDRIHHFHSPRGRGDLLVNGIARLAAPADFQKGYGEGKTARQWVDTLHLI